MDDEPTRPKAVGYWLSSEEHPATGLVRNAVQAERAGFTGAMITDHYHPWVRHQGQSPYVWGVLGAIANATENLRVGTGVSAAVNRMHPALLAQASATAAALFGGRFFLGLGTGERLNENVTGERWPAAGERREMLEETVEIVRELWAGNVVNHRGRHFKVANARLFTLPAAPPELLIAGGGSRSVALAGKVADGLISVMPDAQAIEMFESSGGRGKRKVGQVKVCFADTEEAARCIALEWWPIATLQGGPLSELPRPEDFEAATSLATTEHIGKSIVCGPDPARHVDAIRAYFSAGFDEVYVHQVGPHQDGFFDFYRSEIIPEVLGTRVGSR